MWLIALVGVALFVAAGLAMARLLIGAIFSSKGSDYGNIQTLWGIFWAGFVGGGIFWGLYLILLHSGIQ